MDLKAYAKEAKEAVRNFLENKKTYDKYIPGIVDKITSYATAGKGLRGALVLAHHDIYSGNQRDKAIAAAIAVELFHSAMLMIDDIIDCDDLRRGQPTMHKQLQTLDVHSIADAKKGESFAMCVALITTYMAQELFGIIQDTDIISYMSETYCVTGFAEMKELLIDTDPATGKDEIFDVYVNKTGKYTISMPSIVGAQLAQAPQSDIRILKEVGIDAGILFQLKDDMLEIQGSTKSIGKSIGTDIAMNNKTYPRIILENNCTKKELQELATIYGTRPTPEEITFVKSLHEKYQTNKHIEEVCNTYITSAKEKLATLSIDNSHFLFLLEYNQKRKK